MENNDVLQNEDVLQEEIVETMEMPNSETENGGESALATENDDLKKQVAELKDKYMRQVAEFDNFRRRAARGRRPQSTGVPDLAFPQDIPLGVMGAREHAGNLFPPRA